MLGSNLTKFGFKNLKKIKKMELKKKKNSQI